MRIKRAHIVNFRCLGEIEVIFDDVTTLIGPNGVGKSTILHSLDWFFNGSLSGSLSDDDCTVGSGSTEISVEVEFSNLTEADREALGHYAPEGADTVKIWRYRDASGSERMTANAKAYAPFNTVRLSGSKSDIKAAYSELRSSDSSLGLPAVSSADKAQEAMLLWEVAHPDQLEDAPQQLTTNFFGFNSQGKMSGLFDYVLVKADLRANEQVSDNKSTIIGRILERAIDRTAADTAIALLSEEMLTKQRAIYDENFRDQLSELSDELSDTIAQYSQGREVTIKSDELEIKPPRTQFSVLVKDEEVVTTVDRQGHGFQRTLLISSLQLLAKHGAAGTSNGTICLAIEEPELFQHPVQAQAFASVLRRVAEDATQNIQVAYATHSPYFIHPGRFYQVRRLSRGSAPEGSSPPVSVRQTSTSDIKTNLSRVVRPEVIDNQLDSVALHRLPEALFAKSVVLVEGTSDRAMIEGIGERPGETPLSVSGIVVAEVGGKNNIFLPKAILEELGIPVYIVFDGDKDCEAKMRAAGKPESDIQSALRAHRENNKALLLSTGETGAEWPATRVYAKVCVWEDSLESLIASNWPEWQQKANELSANGLGELRKNQLAYKDVTRMAEGSVPAVLSELLNAIHAV